MTLFRFAQVVADGGAVVPVEDFKIRPMCMFDEFVLEHFADLEYATDEARPAALASLRELMQNALLCGCGERHMRAA
jgi:hypothetical protein